MKIAIVDKCPSGVDYKKYFSFLTEFDVVHLSSKRLTKVLVRDVDMEFDPSQYNYVITVGSEATKYLAKVTSVTDYAGFLVDEKYLPIINPAMLIFKPEAKPAFDRSLEQIQKIISGEATVNTTGDFRLINSSEEAYAYLCQCDTWAEEYDFIAWDTETTSLYPRDGYVLGISISAKPRSGAYISSDCIDEKVFAKLSYLASKYTAVFHNSKFDIKMLQYHFGLFFPVFEDTLIEHYMLDETQGTHGLKQLALKYTDYGDYDRALEEFKENYCKTHKIKKEEFTYDLIPFDIIGLYAAVDTAVTYDLHIKFKPLIDGNPRIKSCYHSLMIPACSMLLEVEENGIPLDKDRLLFAKTTIDKAIESAKAHLYSFDEIKQLEALQGALFNPGSVLQLRRLLFDILKLNPIHKLTGTGLQSTDAEVLESLQGQHPIVDSILTIRKLGKIKSTYVDKILEELDRDNRLRTGFNLTSTTSGRLSSSGKFNAQQIPRDEARVKGSIKARDGYKIVSQDLATAEMYYASVLSGDLGLQKVFISGGDFHSSIAQQVFKLKCLVEEVKELFPEQRQAAKAISFGILYGSGAKKVSDTVSKSSDSYFGLDEAQESIDLYFSTFKQLNRWLKKCKDEISANGFCYTSFGRKRRLKNVFSTDKSIASHEIRSGINAMVQALASDINLFAAIDTINDVRHLDAKIFMLVHDSIVAEVKDEHVEEYCKILKRNTQKDRGFSIKGCPIGVDQSIGQDYSFGKFDKNFGEEYAKFTAAQVSAVSST